MKVFVSERKWIGGLKRAGLCSHDLVVTVVACRATAPGFNSSCFQMLGYKMAGKNLEPANIKLFHVRDRNSKKYLSCDALGDIRPRKASLVQKLLV